MDCVIKGTREDREEIIAFLDEVFTRAYRPHNFAKLLPKVYGKKDGSLPAIHYLLKKDGKLRAVAANQHVTFSAAGQPLRGGLIGSVSVHPDARGRGYMKRLMECAIEEAKQDGLDFLALGGQRQRYGYFGFEPAGGFFSFRVTKDNVRHSLGETDTSPFALRDLTEADADLIPGLLALYEKRPFHAVRKPEDFTDILHTWGAPCQAVLKNNRVIGYCYGIFSEVVLEREEDYPAVLKAYFETAGIEEAEIFAAPFEPERVTFLSSVCESSAVTSRELICVLNWQRVLQALLTLKSADTRLQDGEVSLCIDGQSLKISVKAGCPSVFPIEADKDTAILSRNQAERAFFGLQACLLPTDKLKNWAPLPFALGMADAF